MINSQVDQQLADLFKTKLDIAEHPFIADENTIEFIKNSKILFINRGLPGSGKSTLSKKIRKIYGEDNCVICSGDDYFTDEFGNYNFDHEKLHDAHQWAQNKAREACNEGKSPIIADNTNIKYWEFKPYLNIAKEFNYIVLVIEPRTAHKFDVEKLFLLNKHNVPKEAIIRKLKDFQVVFPIFFGWYLNEKDSMLLTNKAKECFKDAIHLCSKFSQDIIKSRLNSDEKVLFEYKNEKHLHCTSKFIGRSIEKNQSLSDYIKNSFVTESLGKAFKLKITGFSISKRSIAAIVSLNKKEVNNLWGNDLNKNEKIEVLEAFDDLQIDVFDKLQYADRAHITIGLEPGEKAYRAGIDLIRIKLIQKLYETNGENFEKFQNENVEISYFNDCLCFCKLKDPIYFNSLFTGNY